jgi:hypothetical protein
MVSLLAAMPWDLLSYGMPIVMCVGVLGWFARMRRKQRSAGAPAESGSPAPVFSQEVLLQTIRQQTEQALQRVLTAVEAERDKLQRLLAAAEVPQLCAAAPMAETADVHRPFRLGESHPALSAPGPYARLRGLAGRGLSPRQLAEQTNLPLGEIELALKLQRLFESGTRAGTRQ